jgi:hypothetical protein
MTRQGISEWDGSALVEENPHLASLPARNFGKALPCVFQDGFNLPTFHARKPLEEVPDTRPRFEILEERLNRYPRTPKDPGAADLLRRTLDLCAL